MDVFKTILVYFAALVGGLFIGLVMIAMFPDNALLALAMPFATITGTGFFRRRSNVTVSRPLGGEMPISAALPNATAPTEPKPGMGLADEIKRGRQQLWGSAAALIAVIAGICAWAYFDQEQNKATLIHDLLEARAREILGSDYLISRVDFPAGTHAYDYPVAVRVVESGTGDKDLFTLLVRGDCSSGCRIGLDPKDALRLMAKQAQ